MLNKFDSKMDRYGMVTKLKLVYLNRKSELNSPAL